MNNVNKIQWLVRLTAGAAMLVLAAGCVTDPVDSSLVHGEDFPPYEGQHSVSDFVTMQAANAAKADGTLRAYHFDNTRINSLGEERLALILRNGDLPAPLAVYLDLNESDPMTAARRSAVLAYLKDHNLTDDQISLKYGPNPDYNSPVATLLAAQAAAAGAAAPGGAPPAAH